MLALLLLLPLLLLLLLLLATGMEPGVVSPVTGVVGALKACMWNGAWHQCMQPQQASYEEARVCLQRQGDNTVVSL
jgi:hypothetical protein